MTIDFIISNNYTKQPEKRGETEKKSDWIVKFVWRRNEKRTRQIDGRWKTYRIFAMTWRHANQMNLKLNEKSIESEETLAKYRLNRVYFDVRVQSFENIVFAVQEFALSGSEHREWMSELMVFCVIHVY